MQGSFLDRLLLRGFAWQTRGAMTFGGEHPAMVPRPRAGRATLYVHVPFCESLCPFCSFHRVPYREALARRYFHALREELVRYADAGHVFTSVYVGGGTPTVAPDELVRTLALVRARFPVGDISVETNPKDLVPPVLDALAEAGVTRLSVGVQSFDDGLLKEMQRYGRYGSGADVAARLDAAAAWFPTLNVDMIYNLPHQTRASLRRDLDVLLGLRANQTSFYPLMTTGGVERVMARHMGLPDRTHVRPLFDTLLARLRPTFTPRTAWCFARGPGAIDEYIVDADDYVGVGSGAFSYVDGAMYATTFSLHGYVDRVAQGLTGVTGQRQLTDEEQMKHAFLVRLFGLSLDKRWAARHYGDRFFRVLAPAFAAMKLVGAMTEDATTYRLTDRGMYYWVLMMSAFFESVNAFREQMRAHIAEELDELEHAAPATLTPESAPASPAHPS